MMVVIAVLRYRATVHPFKPAISRKKLKIVCGLGYIVGLIGYGTFTPFCVRQRNNVTALLFKLGVGFRAGSLDLFPTVFMVVVYYKITRALIKRNKHMKRVCSNAVRSKYVRNRRTFLVCLGTVFCFGVGTLLVSVWSILSVVGERSQRMKHDLIFRFGTVLRVAETISLHTLIYGILDRGLFAFWKIYPRRKQEATRR